MLLFICSSAAVFVIVAGQPTTDDDGGGVDERVDQLMNAVANLQAEVAELKAERSTKRSDTCNCKSAVLWNVIVCRVYAHYRRSFCFYSTSWYREGLPNLLVSGDGVPIQQDKRRAPFGKVRKSQNLPIQEAQLMQTNPRDAFRGQSSSPMAPFDVRYGFLLVSYSNFIRKIVIFDFM